VGGWVWVFPNQNPPPPPQQKKKWAMPLTYDCQHVMIALGDSIRGGAQPDGPGASKWHLNTTRCLLNLQCPYAPVATIFISAKF
jgi:hypothetical protein